MRPIEIDVRHVGPVTVIRPSGRLDSGRVDIFKNAFDAEIDEGRDHVVIDFEHTDFIASSGLRVLLLARKRIDQRGGRMAMCNMKPHVLSLFRTAGFDRMFFIGSTTDEAIARAMPEGSAPPAAGGDLIVRGRPIARTAQAISSCRLLLGNDSGLAHLAAALSVPVVALFAVSDAAVWAPAASGSPVLVVTPSSVVAGDCCAALPAPPAGASMADIAVDPVLGACRRLLR